MSRAFKIKVGGGGSTFIVSLLTCAPLLWEAVCSGRGGGSRVNTALGKYTEIAAQRTLEFNTQ